VELNAAAASIKNLMDDVVDRHDFDGRFENPLLGRCWAIKNCGATECPCHQNESNLRCWEISGTFCRAKSGGTFARRLEDCRKCEVYQQARTHAVVDLGETFNTMMAILAEREGELRAAATTDKLTGLPNRALLLDRLQQVVVRHRRWNVPGYAVLFLDFDRFKIVNDSLGHDTGDQLLREIARKLQDALRSSDSVSFPAQTATAARLGGDEFVVLLDCLRHPDDARTVAERILNALSLPFKLGNHDIVSTASIGIVTSDCRHDRAEDVLRDADTAMYEAKLAGRGRAMVFDASMRDRVKRKLELENALRKAIETGQFLLHYQPIVSLETGKTEGLEALLRWQHPEHGLISPGEFIPIAEETDLIVPLGEWVAREAFRQLAEWRRLYGREQVPSISINLSRRQLAVPDLPQQLRSIAADAGIEPAAIHLEVTESAIMADTEAATCVLREMKSIGFKVDMDDFGTGYSSLAALQQFPIDVIKIDRSFIANLDRGRDYAALVHAVITLARNLNIDVVAEGVETASQLAALQALECRSAQGYFFARPMPADQAVNDWRCIHPIKTDGVRADSAA
jgi:diguanylate cyclase (GGDEF)-like protein